MENDEKTKPEKTIRVGSGVKATIWQNEGKNAVYPTVVISRTYKDSQGELKDTTSYRRDELLFVAEAAHQAFTYLLNNGEEN
jgi:hypothetical protein